jgi:hypothetical protein
MCSRSVVPRVLKANECLAVVVGSEHQLRRVLVSHVRLTIYPVQETYEEPHRCAETAGSDSVERPDRWDADGVAAVCVREGVCAGHCDMSWRWKSQQMFSKASRSMRIPYEM